MELQTVGDLAELTGINALLYGPTGSGKTTSIKTIPNQDRVLVATSEKGLQSIKRTCKDVKAVKITCEEDLFTVRKCLDVGGKWHGKCDTIVLDSLSETAEMILTEELAANKDGRQAYGQMAETVIKMVRAFIALPINTIFICHQAYIQTDEGHVYFGPSFPGKQLPVKVPHQFDMLFAAQTKADEEGKVRYRFQTNAIDDDFLAKARTDGNELNPYEKPNWAKIYKKLNGGGK